MKVKKTKKQKHNVAMNRKKAKPKRNVESKSVPLAPMDQLRVDTRRRRSRLKDHRRRLRRVGL